mmetsp:Transcript_71664/g.201001  ORF Transcript_71664/g.201001 Transcript_71664/m.201001 type:complete len:354 (+) Transcript_71664:943-2004(+)
MPVAKRLGLRRQQLDDVAAPEALQSRDFVRIGALAARRPDLLDHHPGPHGVDLRAAPLPARGHRRGPLAGALLARRNAVAVGHALCPHQRRVGVGAVRHRRRQHPADELGQHAVVALKLMEAGVGDDEVPGGHRLERISPEGLRAPSRETPGEQLEGHHAHREDVHLAKVAPLLEELGRHVHHLIALLRQELGVDGIERAGPGEAPQLRVAAALGEAVPEDEDVLGADVAVHPAAALHLGQAAQQLDEDARLVFQLDALGGGALEVQELPAQVPVRGLDLQGHEGAVLAEALHLGVHEGDDVAAAEELQGLELQLGAAGGADAPGVDLLDDVAAARPVERRLPHGGVGDRQRG